MQTALTAANDKLSPEFTAALANFYKLVFADEEAAERGVPFSGDASRRIGHARGTDLFNAAPDHLKDRMWFFAVERTMKARGLGMSR